MTSAHPELIARLFPTPDVDFVALGHALGGCQAGLPGAMRVLLETTGKLVAPSDVRGAASGIGERAFVELLIDVGPETVSDEEVTALLELVDAGGLSEPDLHRALMLAGRSLEQPALSDLIFFGREKYTPSRIVELARTHRGKALMPYLDPQCGEPSSKVAARPSPRLPEARAALLTMHETGELALDYGETAAESFATLLETTTDLQGFIAWLEKGDNGIAEVFGSDEELSLRWDTLNGSVN